MIRKTMIGLLVLGGLMFLVKRTSFISYAGTLWGQATRQAKEQVPTKFEIERARREIAAMDSDISTGLRPIAEYMAAINKLKKDIKAAQDALADQKISILAMTRDLDGNPTVLSYGGEEYTAERVRKKLQGDFESYRRCEAHLKSQEKLLEARERSLAASREQLTKLVAKKRDYEIRLAQLEADEETLQTARIGSKLPVPDNRAAEIESVLAEIEHRQEVQRAEIELANGPQAHDFIPVQSGSRTRVADLDEIRSHFGQKTARRE
jgi:chromosome segregation ATPase